MPEEGLIVQVIGDPSAYTKVTFEIEGESYEAFLASDALRHHLRGKGDNRRILLLAPKSLEDKYGGLDKLRSEVGRLLDTEGFDLSAIPSIGEYKLGDERRSYRWVFDDVATSIFLELLGRRPERVLLDVCTGQNVYAYALVEAARRYSTYRSLEGILQGCSYGVEYVTYQPITRGVEKVRVEFGKLTPIAFFQLPSVNIDKLYRDTGEKDAKISERVAEISKRYKNQKRLFTKIQKDAKVAFNAIRYGVPLAFYELLELGVASREAGEAGGGGVSIEDVENSIAEMVREFIGSEIPVSLPSVSQAFFVIAMYKSFKKFRETLCKPTSREIEEKFSEVFERLGLPVNKILLARELEEVRERAKGLRQGERVLLRDLYGAGGSAHEKRNFFAHCGFLSDHTYVEKLCDDVRLEWDEWLRRNARSWLEEVESRAAHLAGARWRGNSPSPAAN